MTVSLSVESVVFWFWEQWGKRLRITTITTMTMTMMRTTTRVRTTMRTTTTTSNCGDVYLITYDCNL